MFNRTHLVLGTLLVLVTFALSAQDPPTFVFTDLGDANDISSEAEAINNSGVVVGSIGFYSQGTTRERAFYYSHGVRSFDYDAGSAPNMTSSALAVNDAGCAVGWTQNTDGAPVYIEMFKAADTCPWSDTVYGANLGGLNTTAYGINSGGLMTGAGATDTGAFHAFSLMLRTTDIIDLGVLPGGSNSTAVDINDDGVIVGHADTASVIQTATRWDDEIPTDLGAFPGSPAGTQSVALAVSNADSPHIVGWSYGSAAGGQQHGFIWQNGLIKDLGTLPGGDTSEAFDVNDNGEAVGWARTADYHVHAVFWDSAGNIIDLNTVDGIPAGWVLAEAKGINNAGQIVGRGVYDGSDRAFLITPIMFQNGFETGGFDGWSAVVP